SAPCAPAVAVLSAFALESAHRFPGQPGHVLVLTTLLGLFAAAIQLALGLLEAGTVIKYIPYPVVTGYLSGVGVVIFLKQLPALPAAIVGLGAGAATYAALSLVRPELRVLAGNALVIGPIGGGGPSFGDAFRDRLASLGGLHFSDVRLVIGPATTLAVVLSLD